MWNPSLKILTTLLCTLALSACGTKFTSSTPTVSQPAPAPRQEPAQPEIAPTTTRPEPAQQRSAPAVIALRDQAAAATAANDHTRAIGLLERTLRIAPDDPQTYYELASNHLALNQSRQALQLARRGLTLSPSNRQRDALNRLIARSESML